MPTYTTKSYVKGIAVIEAAEEHDRFHDAATVTGVAVASATDWLNAVDATTVQGFGGISSVEEYAKVNANTVIGKGIISSDDNRGTTDAATVTGVGVVSATEYRETNPNISIVSGVGVISAVENAQYMDAATVKGKGIIPPGQPYDDAATVIGKGHTTETDDDATFVDAGTATGVGVVSGTFTYGGSDSGTVTGVAVPSATDTAQYIDAATVTGVAGVGQVYDDAATVIGVGQIDTSEMRDFTDTDTAIGVGVPSADEEFIRTIEAATIVGIGVISAEEVAIGTGTGTVEGVGVISGAEAYSAIRGTGNDRGGIAPMTASGTRFTTYAKTGAGVSARTASGVKILTSPNTVTGYVNGGNITNVTTATPMVVTVANHGFTTGETVWIGSVGGVTDANRLWQVGTTTTNTFQLLTPAGGNSTTAQTYTSGGFAHNGFRPVLTVTAASAGSPPSLTAASHGFVTGDEVRVEGATGMTGINGVFTVTNTGTNTFTLDGATGAGTYSANSARVAKITGAFYMNTNGEFTVPNSQKYN